MRIEDAVVLVTGGASGIGAGVAAGLAALGARLALLDRDATAGERVAADIDGATSFAVDVTAPDEVRAAVEAARAHFGRIDALVGAAGVSIPARVLDRGGRAVDADTFRRNVEVNLLGAYDVLRHAAAAMAANEPGPDGERGVVVSIGSIAAFEGQVGQAGYAAAKGGVVALTLPVARDLARHGIRAMTICPGTIDTPMVRATSPEVQASLAEANVFPHRLGTPDDVAALVATCLTTTYLNGETIRLDAGVRLAAR